MRKIETESEKARKKKRNNMIMGIFILVILVFGTIGFAFSFNTGIPNEGQSTDVSGEEIGPYSDRWSLDYQGRKLYFINGPDEVKDIEVDIQLGLSDYLESPLYVVSDNQAIDGEIALNLQQFVPRLQRACLGECEEDLPEKECSDDYIIVVTDSENNIVYQDQKCVFIEGDIKTVDAFLYKLFEIN